MKQSITFAIFLLVITGVSAATYRCSPEFQSIFGNKIQDKENHFIKNYKPYTTVFDEQRPKIERCSFSPTEGRYTCDQYEVDRVELDRNVNIKKYYVFRSQYDIQIFSNLDYIDNNGRGGFLIGKCKLVSP